MSSAGCDGTISLPQHPPPFLAMVWRDHLRHAFAAPGKISRPGHKSVTLVRLGRDWDEDEKNGSNAPASRAACERKPRSSESGERPRSSKRQALAGKRRAPGACQKVCVKGQTLAQERLQALLSPPGDGAHPCGGLGSTSGYPVSEQGRGAALTNLSPSSPLVNSSGSVTA